MEVWKTNKTASMKAAIAERIPPITQFDCGNVTFPLSLVEVNEVNATGGPSYIVIVSAPVMDIMVPIDLARLLRTLKSRFSILVMMASMKVKAGTRSVMAEAKVGELYLIPTYINICMEQLMRPRTKILQRMEVVSGGGGFLL